MCVKRAQKAILAGISNGIGVRDAGGFLFPHFFTL